MRELSARLHARGDDVILLDLSMPDVDGRGFYARIKQAYPELLERLVFVTGDALGPSIRSFLDETGLPYLEKPIDTEELRTLVATIIGKAGTGKAGTGKAAGK